MDFKKFANLYEVRKTVRFELKPSVITRPFHNIKEIELDNILSKILEDHASFINLFGNTFFYKEIKSQVQNNHKNSSTLGKNIFSNTSLEDQEKLKTLSTSGPQNHDIEVNSIQDFSEYLPNNIIRFKYQGIEKSFRDGWIKHKEEIKYRIDNNSERKRKNKNYITFADLGDHGFLQPFFVQLLKNHKNIHQELYELINKEENKQTRISDLTLKLGLLNSREYLGALYTLFEGKYIDHKNDIYIIAELEQKLIKLKENINTALLRLKPLQSLGLPIENLSFNYYTRNKTPKYYNEKIEEKKERLGQPYSGDLGILYGIEKNQPIKNLYEEMKLFKAQQKMAFFQHLQNQISFKNLNQSFKFIDHTGTIHDSYTLLLFKNVSEKNYDEMKAHTWKIEHSQDEKVIKEKKQQRGKYLMNTWGCSDYVNFCNVFKKVALEYGRRRTEVLSLEREKIEAEKERNWGCLSKTKNGTFFLNTFPSKKAKDVYQKLVKNSTSGDISIFLMSSITLRALDKLCFKKGSSFIKSLFLLIDDNYKQYITFTNEAGERRIKDRKTLSEENKLIPFYNHILQIQTSLGIEYRSEQSKKLLEEAQGKVSFERVLKQETYVLTEVKMTSDDIEKLLQTNEGNSYEITSWDLVAQRNHPENYTKRWIEFRSNTNKNDKYPIRINPEATISFVCKDEQFVDKNPDKNNNRRYRDRYILTTSMTHQAHKSYIDSGFIKDDERQESINQFNVLYNKQKSFDYLYGLDKGTNELVTLGIFKKGINTIETVNIGQKVGIYKIIEKGFMKSKRVQKKGGGETEHFLKNNPSLFMEYIDDNTIFEKQDIISCLGDLTSAKVIKGNIILNGDQATIKSLYLTDAKRKLYEKKMTGEMTNETIAYNKENNVFYYEYTNRGKTEKYMFDALKKIYHLIKKEDIEKELKEFVNHIKKDDVSIVKINNLRNAVCANIVGVIIKLQEYFPGYIVWEGLGDDTQSKQQKKNTHTYLGNLINEKLYNKLQIAIDVPPILKKFREEVNVEKGGHIQHGKVLYVDKENTSSACPVCGDKLYGHLKGEVWESSMHHCDNPQNCLDIENHISKENKAKCDYHMKNNPCGFNFINSGDDLAAYNIAKKGKEYLDALIKGDI